LREVGLADVIDQIQPGLDQLLTPYGYPLSVSETMRLKLAYAILCEPRVIVLSHLFDVVDHGSRESIFQSLRSNTDLTLIYFSNRRDSDCFDRFLFASPSEQRYVPSLEQLEQVEVDSWATAEGHSVERGQ